MWMAGEWKIWENGVLWVLFCVHLLAKSVIVNKPSLYNITMNHQFFLSKESNQYRYLCIVFYHGLIHFIEVVYESIFFIDVVLCNIMERKFFFKVNDIYVICFVKHYIENF